MDVKKRLFIEQKKIRDEMFKLQHAIVAMREERTDENGNIDEDVQRHIDASPEALRLIRLEGMDDGLTIAINIAA